VGSPRHASLDIKLMPSLKYANRTSSKSPETDPL
jgi:hypothetical protein